MNLKIGDTVVRTLGGSVKMPLKITEITDDLIICGWWKFDKETLMEIDEDLGWTSTRSGSYVEIPVQ